MTSNSNLPSKVNGSALAERPRTMVDLVMSMKSQISLAISGHTPQERARRAERFARIVVTALRKDAKLQQCSQESFMGAMMTCAQLDLEPNTPQQLAHLIAYNNKGRLECQFQPGYPGLMELAYRSGKVSTFHADVVYKKELEAGLFRYSKGLKPNIEHDVDLLSDHREGDIVAAYAVATMKDGSQVFRVVDKKDIARAKRTSAGASSSYSPWNTSPEAMWMKTAIKRLCSFLPRTEQLSLAVEMDDKAERGEQQWEISGMDEPAAPSLNDALAAEADTVDGEIVPDAVPAQPEAPWNGSDPPTMPKKDAQKPEPILPATLAAVEKELKRLNVPGYLPPELSEKFDTGEPGELDEWQGQEAIKVLKAMK